MLLSVPRNQLYDTVTYSAIRTMSMEPSTGATNSLWSIQMWCDSCPTLIASSSALVNRMLRTITLNDR